MAKSALFYTIDEAAKKLGKSPDDVRGMIKSNQLQEFRDSSGDLVVKREAVDMLASGDGDAIPLADSGEMISLAADDSKSGSGSGAKERSGISIFEGEDDSADASAQTLITQSQGGMAVDPSGSGSGLLDMTKNAEDTSLGAGLLEDVYNDGSKSGGSADIGAGMGDSNASNAGLFENAGVASDVGGGAAPVGMVMMAEPYDGAWSGISGGLALAIVLITGAMLSMVIMGIMGASGGLVSLAAANLWAIVGGFGLLVVIGAGVGWVLGRKS